MSYEVIHLGGGETVTGSCHLLRVSGLNILVDCGLAQGHDGVVPVSEWPMAEAPKEIRLVHGEDSARRVLGLKLAAEIVEERRSR